jgi:hypothetical protein
MLTVSYNPSYSGISFLWTITAGATSPVPSIPYGSAGYVSNPNSAVSGSGSYPVAYKTSNATLGLSAWNFSPGVYTVSVIATDAQGAQSPAATATITLINADFSALQVYPNPWRSDKHSGINMTFANLPLNSTVKIFTISGHLIKTITPTIATATWDLTNDSGDKVASGIYIYLITTGDTGYGVNGQKVRGKVAVIK